MKSKRWWGSDTKCCCFLRL